MLNDDRAAKKAEELYGEWQNRTGCDNPPRFYRDEFVAIIADGLRESYGEIEKWHSRAQGQSDIADHVGMENSDLKAEIACLKEKLNQKDDEYEQQCKHAEAEITRLRAELAKERS